MDKSEYKSKIQKERSIGIVGGGQLAQMLCKAARKRNLDVFVQASTNKDPAVPHCNQCVLSPPEDAEGTRRLSELSTHITFENEWLDIEKLDKLYKTGVNFIPTISSLSHLVEKISQRRLLQRLNIPGPKWLLLEDIDKNHLKLPFGWQFPIMAKCSKGGYDGKGTKKIEDYSDLSNLLKEVNLEDWFLESWVQYRQELAIVASRDINGTIRAFPLVETFQKDQICDWISAPASVGNDVKQMAYNIVCSILVELNYVGVLAIEFFYGDNGLEVNEIAPRTHNSGHFSIEACSSSQFDQQICIVAGLDLPEPKLLASGALMVNLIGLNPKYHLTIDERLDKIRNIEGTCLHWYGKESERPGRKLGHVTVLLGEDKKNCADLKARQAMSKIRAIWPMY